MYVAELLLFIREICANSYNAEACDKSKSAQRNSSTRAKGLTGCNRHFLGLEIICTNTTSTLFFACLSRKCISITMTKIGEIEVKSKIALMEKCIPSHHLDKSNPKEVRSHLYLHLISSIFHIFYMPSLKPIFPSNPRNI